VFEGLESKRSELSAAVEGVVRVKLCREPFQAYSRLERIRPVSEEACRAGSSAQRSWLLSEAPAEDPDDTLMGRIASTSP